MSEIGQPLFEANFAFDEFHKADPFPDDGDLVLRHSHLGSLGLEQERAQFTEAENLGETLALTDNASLELIEGFAEAEETEAEAEAEANSPLERSSILSVVKPNRELPSVPTEALKLLLINAEQYRLLRPDEELRLAKGIEKGNLRDKEMLINSNLRYVIKLAQVYRGLGLSIDDLVQEGNVGLIRAAEKFDHRKGYRFSTYATWWIRQGIQRGLDNTGRTIRYPANIAQSQRQMEVASAKFAKQHFRDPTDEELMDVLAMDATTFTKMSQLPRAAVSLSTPTNDEDGTSTLGDFVLVDHKDAGYGGIEIEERATAVREALSHSSISQTEHGKEVIELRFGLTDGTPYTVAQTAKLLGIPKVDVERIEERILNKLERILVV